MNDAANSVFQNMKAAVMASEKETLEIYLKKIEQLQEALFHCDPVAEMVKYERLTNALDKTEDRVKKMHGIEALRDAHVDLAKTKEKAKLARSMNLGLHDDRLKEGFTHSLPGIGESDGGAFELDGDGDVVIVG